MVDSYLIDGYNLIHALGLIDRQLGTHALEQSRKRLFDFLKKYFGDNAAQVCIVFDAQHAPANVPPLHQVQGLRIIFAPAPQSADDLIEILIDRHASPRTLVVISNDHRLQQSAVRRGSRAWSHNDLLDYLEQRQSPDDTNDPAAMEDKPTQSMSSKEKAHWMKEFESLEADPELKEFFDMDRFDE